MRKPWKWCPCFQNARRVGLLMFPRHWLHAVRLTGLLALTSCQLVSGLDELDVPEGAVCLQGWETHTCRGQCGDDDDGIRIGCGNFMACYIDNDCLPDGCSKTVDDICGNNSVEGGNDLSFSMATGVVNCMCGP